MTPRQLVNRLGGSAAVAEACDLPQSAVANWYRRGIPATHHIAVWRLAIEAGVRWSPPGAHGLTLCPTVERTR